ncbi:MAG: universal stress protein [Betaproteobacteria bacterium]|nr:universal stress protein [Betaproteobacteria bacterium]
MMFDRVLLAFDGSQASKRALADVTPIAKLTQGIVKLLAVFTVSNEEPYLWATGGLVDLPAETPQPANQQAENMLKREVELLEASGLLVQSDVVFGDPVEEVVKAAALFQADVIVLGHQRYNSWLERWWRGSTAQAVIERAHCNVFISIHD